MMILRKLKKRCCVLLLLSGILSGHPVWAQITWLSSVMTPAAAEITGGTILGSTGSWTSTSTREMSFDNNTSTYFEGAVPDGQWVGKDLGAMYNLAAVGLYTRNENLYVTRMTGGVFQTSTDAAFTAPVTFYTIASGSVIPNRYNYIANYTANTLQARYVRYLSPAGGYGEVAEFKFYGTAVPVTPTTGTTAWSSVTATPADPEITVGTILGSTGSWTGTSTREMSFDNNTNSYFEGGSPDGQWVGKDLGAAYNITSVGFYTRTEALAITRLTGGMFQTSTDAAFTSPVTFYTVPSGGFSANHYNYLANNGVATPARYIRYLSPSNGYGEVAELKFYGTAVPVITPPVTNTSQTWTSNVNSAGYKLVGAAGSNKGLSIDANGNAFADSSLIVTGSMYASRLGGIYNESVPDYVFEDKYPLRSLAEISSYIKQYKHLPEVPSDAEYKKRGSIDVVEMNLLLLRKVEELTLHMIRLDKKIKALQAKQLKK